jgi:hypothetical protein
MGDRRSFNDFPRTSVDDLDVDDNATLNVKPND